MDASAALGFTLHLLHLWVWALYCGGLTHIYFRLVPDIRRWLASDERYEEFSLTTAHGLRWWIFGALITAGVTGVGLVLVRPQATDRVWWGLVGAKAVLLLVTLALYAYVSYVMWPRRVFVATADRPAMQRRFLRVAWLLIGLLTSQLLLGALAYARP